MMRFLLFLLLGASLATVASAQAPKIELPKLEVSVNRIDQDGQHMYEVDSTGTVAAALPKVWRILTGYERMSEFVPDMESCKVLSRNGNEIIIEQFGVARFLFMSKTIHLIVRAVEQPMSSIDISLISGDMKHYESRWELVPVPETGGTKIIYHGKLQPNFYVPGILGSKMIRGDIERMMSAVLARIDRRDSPKVEAIPQKD
ncbi:Ribosome association toxin PasT (RatA) of the RatAB toxin-antitoxin module [Duganella sacchari]|uniref:Ribosome association toxin PasT (RatA) of the RatAB toxin-antitoxin module n=1 Tax=Duganella sacchari TaxID=551987 RepID=A0A1M7M4E7_9BURK|nr:Ribosome association toxin PasT (RatA) of the RatAB toxin-antitoxin module [Duganella sacchari]